MASPIIQWSRSQAPFSNRSDLILTVLLVPPGLPTDHIARHEADDRSIAVPKEFGSLWFQVIDRNTGAPIANATFAADAVAARCDTIEVTNEYRRQGIASEIYRHVSVIFAAPVVPSDCLSDDARAFWNGRDQIIG